MSGAQLPIGPPRHLSARDREGPSVAPLRPAGVSPATAASPIPSRADRCRNRAGGRRARRKRPSLRRLSLQQPDLLDRNGPRHRVRLPVDRQLLERVSVRLVHRPPLAVIETALNGPESVRRLSARRPLRRQPHLPGSDWNLRKLRGSKPGESEAPRKKDARDLACVKRPKLQMINSTARCTGRVVRVGPGRGINHLGRYSAQARVRRRTATSRVAFGCTNISRRWSSLPPSGESAGPGTTTTP